MKTLDQYWIRNAARSMGQRSDMYQPEDERDCMDAPEFIPQGSMVRGEGKDGYVCIITRVGVRL